MAYILTAAVQKISTRGTGETTQPSKPMPLCKSMEVCTDSSPAITHYSPGKPAKLVQRDDRIKPKARYKFPGSHPKNSDIWSTVMDGKSSITADTLELLLLNQIALRAALEELSLWVSRRGSVHVHENVMGALTSLDTNAEAISSGLERLRG